MFEPINFITSLVYMAKGMLSIIIVIGIIILITMLLSKIAKDKN